MSQTDVLEKQTELSRIIDSAERLGVEIDVDQATKWLKSIEEHADDHTVIADEDAGVFGHRMAMLDFSPRQLARFREIGKIVEFEDVPGQVETALALSGSAAQGKVQAYPGDCDYFERVNISAETWSDACTILANIMRQKIHDYMSGDTYQFVEAKFGEYPFDCRRDGDFHAKGSPISWMQVDINEGYIVVNDLEDRPTLLRWDDVRETPGWCKLDWIIIDPERRELAFASNMLDVTWEAPDGTITPLDGYLDAYFQEVYLDAESHPIFTKLVKHVSPDMLSEYVDAMEQQVKKYTNLQDTGMNYGKAAKRLYNLFRLTGRYEEAAFLRELFDEPAALLYQVNALLKTVNEASLPGSNIHMDDLINQCDELIMDVIRVLEGAKEVEIVRYLLKLEHAICRHERGDALNDEIGIASREVINIVNNFFHERMHALPTIDSYLTGLHSAETA